MKIEDITNKDVLINKIINQFNSLNKKIKKFDNNDISAHKEYRENLLQGLVSFNTSGSITKSKKFYKDKSILQLQKILAIAHKINNHETLGTVVKYKKSVTVTISKIQEYAKNLLREKGYSEEWILNVVNDSSFIYKLLDELNAKAKSFGSDQVIEQIALSYKDDGIDDKRMKRILNDIETTQRALQEIKQENDDFQEFKRMRGLDRNRNMR